MKFYLSENIDFRALEKMREHADIVSDFSNVEEIDAMVVRSVRVTREVIEKAKNLKVIGKHGVGYDTIDIQAAEEHGVRVVYTPTANVRSVAELIVAFMTNLSRNISQADHEVRRSSIDKIAPKELTGLELEGKTLGLVGVGNIARQAAGILQRGFDMKVAGYDRYLDAARFADYGFEKYDDLCEMIGASDYVSVSLPLTDETRGMIGEKELQAFKPSGILVNTARGGIVDERALYKALKEGWLRSAASDVFMEEPPNGENPLVGLANFIATPHIGACTEEALYRMGMTVVEGVLDVLGGNTPKYPVV